MFGDAEKLFTRFLHLDPPWKVSHVDIDDGETEVTVDVVSESGPECLCPDCGCVCRRGEKVTVWRHSDLFDMTCKVRCTVKTTECTGCGKISESKVPWSNDPEFQLMSEI